MTIRGKYFYGNKISNYGLQNKRVDYGTLAKCFDAVLNNEIIGVTANIGYWDMISNGTDQDQIDMLNDEIEHLTDILNDMDEDTEGYKALDDKIDGLMGRVAELEEFPEIYQYYIVSDNAVEILEEAHQIVFYNDDLDMYVWGVTHYGTSWDYVLTDIAVEF